MDLDEKFEKKPIKSVQNSSDRTFFSDQLKIFASITKCETRQS